MAQQEYRAEWRLDWFDSWFTDLNRLHTSIRELAEEHSCTGKIKRVGRYFSLDLKGSEDDVLSFDKAFTRLRKRK